MNIKMRLTIMSFFQFFVWGAWLITIATYFFGSPIGNVENPGAKFGAIFSTLALASIFMPALTGIIADKFIDAEKLYGVLHILYGCVLFIVPQVTSADTLYYVIFAAMIFYMPTISLSNSVAYTILKDRNYDVVKVFPPIRVWGTVGFIVAMWVTNLTGSKGNTNQFLIAGVFAVALGIYSFTLPKCAPRKTISKNAGFLEQAGLQAFALFGKYKIALFFIFSMLLGGALQLTNMYGDTFLDDFKKVPAYGPESFVVKYSTIVMSISQFSETLFILAIPFFLKRFGIKKVMIFSMLAWVLRFGLFSFGNPEEALWMLIFSCVVYGMAFDFFNISGSLFIETTTAPAIRSSAQGLFMMMTNGVGAWLGSKISGWMIDKYYTLHFTDMSSLLGYMKTDAANPAVQEVIKFNTVDAAGHFANPVSIKEWQPIWLNFAIYALVVTVLFIIFFKHDHKAQQGEVDGAETLAATAH